MSDSLAQKLDLEHADVQIGGITVTSAMKLKWDTSIKSADTVKRGKVISTAEADEQAKGQMEIEQWEIGSIENELRKEGKKKGQLTGLISSINIVDKYGRKFSAPQVRFVKGSTNWDEKAADDKGTIDFDILGDFEADIHGGNQ